MTVLDCADSPSSCSMSFIKSAFFNAEDENMSIYAMNQFVWKVKALILQTLVQMFCLSVEGVSKPFKSTICNIKEKHFYRCWRVRSISLTFWSWLNGIGSSENYYHYGAHSCIFFLIRWSSWTVFSFVNTYLSLTKKVNERCLAIQYVYLWKAFILNTN